MFAEICTISTAAHADEVWERAIFNHLDWTPTVRRVYHHTVISRQASCRALYLKGITYPDESLRSCAESVDLSMPDGTKMGGLLLAFPTRFLEK